jgi:hypothetical protein
MVGTRDYSQPTSTPQGDPHYSNVKLLLHMDGTSGSTTFVDNSPSPYPINVFGNAKVNTSTVKFGTGSLETDGIGDYLQIDSSVKGFINARATDAWTAELWVYTAFYSSIKWNSTAAVQFSLGVFDGFANNDFLLAPITGANLSSSFYALPSSAWTHVAVVNDPNTSLMKLYIGGGEVASQPSKPMTTMARISGPSTTSFNGFIDDVRITVGVARYTSNFTPPTEAFPNYGFLINNTPQISTSYSLDGKSWSQDHFISAGGPGETRKRLVWRRQGFMRNYRVQRFRGTSSAKISFLRLEAQVEALAY